MILWSHPRIGVISQLFIHALSATFNKRMVLHEKHGDDVDAPILKP